MDNNNILLFDPPHVLPPNVVLRRTCEMCGDELSSPYYFIIGIPPSPLIIASFACGSIDEEKEDIGKSIMSAIQNDIGIDDIKSKYQWIFSEQNIMSSKIRCVWRLFWRVYTPSRFECFA